VKPAVEVVAIISVGHTDDSSITRASYTNTNSNINVPAVIKILALILTVILSLTLKVL